MWGTHVLEAPVEALQLLLGELGLCLQLVKPLWLVAHCGQLQLTVAAVWGDTDPGGGTCGPGPAFQCGCPALGGSKEWGDSPCVTTRYGCPGCALHKWTGCRSTAHSGVPPGLSAALLLTHNGPSLLGSPGACPPSQPYGGMGVGGGSESCTGNALNKGRWKGNRDKLQGTLTFKTQFLDHLLHAALPDFPQEWEGHPSWLITLLLGCISCMGLIHI